MSRTRNLLIWSQTRYRCATGPWITSYVEAKMPTTPGIPRRSPIQVLPRLDAAWLRWSDENRYIQRDMVVGNSKELRSELWSKKLTCPPFNLVRVRDLSSATAIPRWKHRFSSEHRSQATSGPVSTWMGDRLGIPGAVDFFSLPSAHCNGNLVRITLCVL